MKVLPLVNKAVNFCGMIGGAMWDLAFPTEIQALKSEAKKHYLAYSNILDSYDCGNQMLCVISASALRHKIEFNRIMDKLSLLDPECPSRRL